MSVDYLTIVCDSEKKEGINEVRETFQSLASAGNKELKNRFYKQETLCDYEEILNFSEGTYVDSDIEFVIEAVIDDVEVLFTKILSFFDTLNIKIYRCVYTSSAGGEDALLQYVDNNLEWKKVKYLPATEIIAYINGIFGDKWLDNPQDIIVNMGGNVTDSKESANLLIIGNKFDRNIREYFFINNIPVITEDDLGFVYEDELCV